MVQAYDNVHRDKDGWVSLIDIKEEMKMLDTEFASSDYQNTRRLAEKVILLTETFPSGIIEVDEKLDSKPVIHHIRIDTDTFRFIEAYKQAPIREQGGWVLLTYIGQELKKRLAYENGFTYHGVKKSQLLKFVNEIVQAYPKFIKIRKKTNGKSEIYRVRVKL
ncbi:MAG: hypothetical protein Q9P44_14445 [Anaerolineae bacterium]|nr:hypothetical protein [Anaerolineae bacterium]